MPNRILPTQEFNSKLYTGASLVGALHGLLDSQGDAVWPVKTQMHPMHGDEMSTPKLQLDFLKFYVTLTKATRILEVGTYIGSTTIQLAKHIGASADIYTLEKFPEFAEIAQLNFNANGVGENVKLVVGDAMEQMHSLSDSYFDLIYIDGAKQNYLGLCKIAERKLARGGSIIVDDIFFHGDALNHEPSTEKGKGCKAVLDHYRYTAYNKYLLPINNGILILQDA